MGTISSNKIDIGFTGAECYKRVQGNPNNK